jgi:hypothetical protein
VLGVHLAVPGHHHAHIGPGSRARRGTPVAARSRLCLGFAFLDAGGQGSLDPIVVAAAEDSFTAVGRSLTCPGRPQGAAGEDPALAVEPLTDDRFGRGRWRK